MPTIHVLNGPNLNLLGVREPHIYGTTTLGQIQARCDEVAERCGLRAVFRQTNHEGQLIDWLHAARTESAGIVINPAAWSFTSIAILDALKATELPVFEVHLSNIHRREPIYHKSLVSSIAVGVICGLGPAGYEAAILSLATHLQSRAAAG